MNELFDKLILRILFTLFICLLLYFYKQAHRIFYPSSRLQLFKRYYPSKNSANTIHLFSRIIGIGIIFSEYYFYLSDGILFAIIDFLIQGTTASIFYLLSIYIVESIVLYNFEFNDEIIKRKNMAYALICFSHSIGLAYILKHILNMANGSLIVMIFAWLLAMVLVGLATKSFSVISKLPFNRLLIQKNMAIAASYMGFFWGWIIILSSAFDTQVTDIKWYSVHVILKIVLALIIFPIFKKGIIYVFQLNDDLEDLLKDQDISNVEVGHGIYEGLTFLTSCFLTTVITGQINFGTFYPIF